MSIFILKNFGKLIKLLFIGLLEFILRFIFCVLISNMIEINLINKELSRYISQNFLNFLHSDLAFLKGKKRMPL